jgi:hypothetical protein
MIQPDIYLDIDGVLLANDKYAADGAAEFIEYVLTRYPNTTYWLTTHCNGDASAPVNHISHLFDDKTIQLLKRIKATSWQTAKTRGIDFSKPFLWFDDDLFFEEEQTLLQNGVLDNLIEVDLAKNPSQLRVFMQSFPVPVDLIQN